MTTSDAEQQPEHTYVFDPENAAEMARLITQSQLVTQCLDGPIPAEIDMAAVHDVLDIASGPGSWALDVARDYPHTRVIGVDISALTTQFAHYMAREKGLDNAEFKIMNVLKPLEFPDNSFDIVNARLLIGFMPARVWPDFIQECLRVTRPGGYTILTECDSIISNGPSFEYLNGLGSLAFKKVGISFSPDGRNFGITPMIGRFLRDAGYHDVQSRAYGIDWSADTDLHTGFYQDFVTIFKMGQPLLMKTGLITQEEADMHYERALYEMMQDNFCAIWYYRRVWGQK
jgi:ubiquinone/menaquinone biosynthesis C-methylase UbiE